MTWVLLTLLFSTASFASDNCSTIQSMGQSLGPVFDQHCTSWCAIFTASDMFTQKLQKTGLLKKDERLHPLSVAGQLLLALGGDPNARGAQDRQFSPWIVQQSILRLRPDARFCKESDFGSDMSMHNKLFVTSKSATEELMKAFESAKRCNDLSQMGKLIGEVHEISRKTWSNMLTQKCHLPRLDVDTFNLKLVQNEKREAALLGPRPIKDDPVAAEALAKEIDSNLQQGRIAGIAMDIDSFVDPQNNQLVRECGSLTGGLHWASVIARRRDSNGVCEYQVRSSWGQSCEGFYNPRKCNRDGTFWIPRADLSEKVADVEYIP